MLREIQFFSFQTKTVFIPLRFVYPECNVLIEEHTRVFPLRCYQDNGCSVDASCPDIMARRIDYLFQNVVKAAELIILYFKYRDRAQSIRGGLFWRDLREPRVMLLNKSGFEKCFKEGEVHTWDATNEFLYMGSDRNIIPVENLIKSS